MSTPAPDGLWEAFTAYERALADDDLATLDRLFAPGADTLRGDGEGLLVGHDRIGAFRRARGGAPARRLLETHVQVVDPDHATVVAVTELERGGRGLQTQVWQRRSTGWKITAAHVTAPAPAVDGRVWRVVGTPLVAGSPGPLTGTTVAVKDVYAVAGHRVGAGNPAWLADAPVETEHAWAVARLLAAGADVTGIARTDELAFSLAGTNRHHGTPPNPAAPGRISGGSTSGPASAVAAGQVEVGLGTDTAGSVRVPAAYQGLWGIRTTHGLLPRDGVLPLAPSFDAVGWLARDAATLRRVGEVLLPGADPVPDLPGEPVVPEVLLDGLDPDVRAAVVAAAQRWSAAPVSSWPGGHDASAEHLDAWPDAFATVQAHEAWTSHRDWLGGHLDTLAPDVRSRFERGRDLGAAELAAARDTLVRARAALHELTADRVVLVPSAPCVAPQLGEGLADRLQQVRRRTLRLTCLASLAGLPAVSVPLRTDAGLPAGVCLVGAPGRDLAVLALAQQLAQPPAGTPAPQADAGAGRGAGGPA